MNLIDAYLENQNSQINMPVFSSNQSGAWDLFHNLLSKTVAVFAGRDTGKTYHTALRAIQSPSDSLILVCSESSFKVMRETLLRLDGGYPSRLSALTERGSHLCITYMSGKTIKVKTMRSFTIEGYSFKNLDVYIEEPELMNEGKLCRLIDSLNTERAYNQLLFVGSIYEVEDSVAKRFFNSADTKCFIDNEEGISLVGFTSHELVPSCLTEFIGELQPLF